MSPRKLSILAFFILGGLLVSCQYHPDQRIIRDHWQYPVKLGSQRITVHTLLGAPFRCAPDLEVYPPSGVSIWYDGDYRVTKLRFNGQASFFDIGDSTDYIPSNSQILQGLTPHYDLTAFKLTFGAPIIENAIQSKLFSGSHCVWRGDGLVIVGQFLDSTQTYQGKQYHKGTLVWFDIFRGL
jgi:hypothetical protein